MITQSSWRSSFPTCFRRNHEDYDVQRAVALLQKHSKYWKKKKKKTLNVASKRIRRRWTRQFLWWDLIATWKSPVGPVLFLVEWLLESRIQWFVQETAASDADWKWRQSFKCSCFHWFKLCVMVGSWGSAANVSCLSVTLMATAATASCSELSLATLCELLVWRRG